MAFCPLRTMRELLLVKAKDALERMDQPHIEFKGKDATQVTYPKAPASASRPTPIASRPRPSRSWRRC